MRIKSGKTIVLRLLAKKGIGQMNTVEGFFIEGGLFLKCPHCKNSTRQNVQSFFLSIHLNKPATCTQCEKKFTINVELRPFVEAVEHTLAVDCAYCHCSTTIIRDGVHCVNCGLVYKSHSH